MARPRILVCFAVKEESRAFASLASDLSQVDVLVTGMGPANAMREFKAAAARILPELVITAGFAGGLNPSLTTGTVVFEADTRSGLEARLFSAGAIRGSFYCADRVAVTVREKAELRAKTAADVVEMESGVIRNLCHELGLPAATVRVVLDTATEDLPLDFNAVMTPDLRVDSLKLAAAIVCSPGKIPALLRLQKQTRAAAASLTRVLKSSLEMRGAEPD